MKGNHNLNHDDFDLTPPASPSHILDTMVVNEPSIRQHPSEPARATGPTPQQLAEQTRRFDAITNSFLMLDIVQTTVISDYGYAQPRHEVRVTTDHKEPYRLPFDVRSGLDHQVVVELVNLWNTAQRARRAAQEAKARQT
jgi:hypothetical protein